MFDLLMKPQCQKIVKIFHRQTNGQTYPLKLKKLVLNEEFSCQSLKTLFIGFVIAPVMCIVLILVQIVPHKPMFRVISASN